MVTWKGSPDDGDDDSREVWSKLMESTRKLRDSIWGDEKLPEREED